ncbi:Uncharacterised protein [Klebsiella pneumoniae]|nr:Uncharacterised protein [Klebsiella pneumoniae]VUH27437.1 Uncharacterised protein [Klebsiella pneumoniae]
MNYFEATQSAYTRTPVRLPEWGEDEYLFWGILQIPVISVDENGIESMSYDDYTGLCRTRGDDAFPYQPGENDEYSSNWSVA